MALRCERDGCERIVDGAYRVRGGVVSCAACEPGLPDSDALTPAEWAEKKARIEEYRDRRATVVEVGDR